MIAAAIGRTETAVKMRWRDFGAGFSANTRPADRTKPFVPSAESVRLADARARQDAVSALLGDPPPGFSALEQMSGRHS
jgi:hypothetical protein